MPRRWNRLFIVTMLITMLFSISIISVFADEHEADSQEESILEELEPGSNTDIEESITSMSDEDKEVYDNRFAGTNEINDLSNQEEETVFEDTMTTNEESGNDEDMIENNGVESDGAKAIHESEKEATNETDIAIAETEGEASRDEETEESAEEKPEDVRLEEQVAKNGFARQNGKIYYYEKGKKVTGQKKIGGYWYMFDKSTGAMKTGFVNIPSQNKTVYYDSNGRMVYGQKKIGGYWYNFKSGSGAMRTEFVRIPSQNKTVYYDGNGRMVYGQKKIGGYWYNFKSGSGAMQTGFVRIPSQSKTVYYDGNGRMVYGQKKIGGYWYNFKSGSGAMQTGFVRIPSQNKTVYYDSKGRMVYGQKKIGDYWYMFKSGSGAMATGWFNHTLSTNAQGFKRVYYNNKGRMLYGTQVIGGKNYVFDKSSGALLEDASGNKAALNVYGKVIQSIKNDSDTVRYTYEEITGDGIKELLIISGKGVNARFQIYSYSSGSAVCVLNEEDGRWRHMPGNIVAYSGGRSIVIRIAFHGHETYSYLSLKSGNFERVASKGRYAI